jgi:hypothetical protein
MANEQRARWFPHVRKLLTSALPVARVQRIAPWRSQSVALRQLNLQVRRKDFRAPVKVKACRLVVLTGS